MATVWLNGQFLDESVASVSVRDAGLLHAAGAFTTMRSYSGRVFAMDRHLARLRQTCGALFIPMTVSDDVLTSAAHELLSKNNLADARLRLTATRGTVRQDPLHGTAMSPNLFLTAAELETYPAVLYERGMTVVLLDEQKLNPYDSQAGHKTLNYLSRLLALRSANERSANEALWFNVHNYLQSGCVSNVFMVKNGELVTPPAPMELRESDCPYPRSNVLPGVTRSVVIELANEAKIPVRFSGVNVTQLLEADEVFMTNSVMQLMPVSRIERSAVGDDRPGRITLQLAAAYEGANEIMKLSDITAILESIAPTRFAESWDNVGLLAGDPAADVSRILLTIDYTVAVAAEAKSLGCGLVVAYHPPIFEPLKRLRAGEIVFDAIRNGIAIYSPHTALDVADGGTNDMLADILGLQNRVALKLSPAAAAHYKLVTFVPAANVEEVSDALFHAGAGRIGKYSSCSFRSAGEGTFFGESGTNPAVGEAGRLERTPEIRLETVVPVGCVAQVIAALRKSHLYEEPAFDLNLLAAAPDGRGMGRIGSLDVSRAELLETIKRGLGIAHLLVAGPTSGQVKRAAVCAGACGNLLHAALAERADLLLTGEVRHHDALKAAAAGMTVVCALHSNSERPVLERLKAPLQSAGLEATISSADRDPFVIR